MTEVNPEITVSNETELESAGSMMWNIFVSPVRVFQRIKAKPTWILPFIIFMLISSATAYVVTPLALEQQKQETMSNENMSQEQREQTVQQMETFKGLASAIGVVGGIFGAAVIVFLSAAIILIMGTVVFGGSVDFMKLVALVSFTHMVDVVGQIVKIPLIVSKGTMDVRTSLAVLLPGSDMKSLAYIILNSLTDIFFIWQIVLLIFGVAVLYNFAKGKAAAAVLIPVGVVFAIISVVKTVF